MLAKTKVAQIPSIYTPIDADFHADFKNVSLYRVILYISRNIRNLLHNLADFGPGPLILLNLAVNCEYLTKYAK